MFDVRKKRGVQLGIVQSDVLEYIRDISDDQELKVIATKLAAVYPLYKEEVHVLGDLPLKTLQDLQGKRVAIGPQRSGTYLTAKTIFFQTGITPSKRYFSAARKRWMRCARAKSMQCSMWLARRQRYFGEHDSRR